MTYPKSAAKYANGITVADFVAYWLQICVVDFIVAIHIAFVSVKNFHTQNLQHIENAAESISTAQQFSAVI